jgi:hypothetical protein
VLDQRGRLLRAALGFVSLRDAPPGPALTRLHSWLDPWSGIGHVVAGMVICSPIQLGLMPITTPAYSPESNGLAEAFVGARDAAGSTREASDRLRVALVLSRPTSQLFSVSAVDGGARRSRRNSFGGVSRKASGTSSVLSACSA